MKLYQAVLVLYLAALAANIAAGQGDANGNTNGNDNIGSNSGNSNGNFNLGSLNGNQNGNLNIGNLNGNTNGNENTGNLNGNSNGNLNTGSLNGNGNGNLNLGSGNGNRNGNGNLGSGNGNGNGNGNIGSGNGNGNGNGNAGGKGDPIFTGFAGRSFEFFGAPGSYYNVLSERNHQISTKLKVGVMWDHNGTYMEGIGFHYRSHKVLVELNPADPDTLAVTLDGEPLAIKAGQVELDHVVESADVHAELTMHWHLHRADFGESIELQTELMKVLVWVTPAGTLDEGGVPQPSYLNFDTTLLAAPLGNEMQGIVGETYERLLAGADNVQDPEHPLYKPDDFLFHGSYETEEYEMAGYFDDSHPLSLLGKTVAASSRRLLKEDLSSKVAFPLRAAGGAHRRQLAETAVAPVTVKFPLTASGRGLVRQPAKAEASGGRRGLF